MDTFRKWALLAFGLPAFCFGGSASTPNGDVITWPDNVYVVMGTSFTIPIQITPGINSVDNVAGISGSGAGVSLSNTFITLATGTTTTYKVPGIAGAMGTAMANLSVITGINGGADNPPLTVNIAVTSGPPTDDKTNADKKGEPVSTATGELYKTFPADLSLGGPLALEFRRYYASLLTFNRPPTTMGANWTNNFDWLLIVNGGQAQLFRFGGREIDFIKGTTGSWQLANPEQYVYQLIAGTSNFQFLDPRTNLIYTFAGSTGSLPLASIQDRNGNTLTLTQASGITTISDGLGRTLTLTYDPTSKNLIKVADQAGRTLTFAYTNGNLTQFTDANGNTSKYNYAGAGSLTGLLTGETLPAGNTPLTQSYDSSGRVATQADSQNNATKFSYGTNTTSYTDPNGVTTTDTSKNLSQFVTFADPDNQTISVTYDNNDHRTSVTDRLGGKITQTFDPASGYLTSQTNAAGNKTSYSYISQTALGFTFYKMSQAQYPDGSTTTFSYDANGNATSITDQAGKIWKFAYNSKGQISSVTDAAGRAQKYTYNTDFTVATSADAAGNVTTYSYDSAKRLSQMKFADGTSRSFTYDNNGNILKTVDERGNTVSFAWDANDRISSVTDALGGTRSMTFNNDDLLSKQVNRDGGATTLSYDKDDLLSTVVSPAGKTYTVKHDTHQRVAAILDSSGNGVSFGYNKEDILNSITDGLGNKTGFTLDALGYPLQITTPLNENYTLTRDVFERAVSSTDPTGLATKLTWDKRGLLGSFTVGALGTSFSYDDGGLVTSATDPNGNAWTVTRDAAGREGTRTDPLNRASKYSYDQRSRWASIQTPLGTVNFTYDAAGNLTQRQYSDSTNLQYTYDKGDRMTGGPAWHSASTRRTALWARTDCR